MEPGGFADVSLTTMFTAAIIVASYGLPMVFSSNVKSKDNKVDPKDEEMLKSKGYKEGDRVILYDGVCNMCNGWVNFVLDRDEKALFRFAALQGDTGKTLMRKMGRNPEDLSTLVMLDSDGTVYTKSEAVLTVVHRCGGVVGNIAWLLKTIFPRWLRNFVYSYIVAPNRYLMFGKDGEKCRMMTKELKVRFLD